MSDPVPLKDYIQVIIDERTKWLNEALRSRDDALRKAEQALVEYKHDSNQYRETFLPRAEFVVRHDQLGIRLDGEITALDGRLNRADEARADFNSRLVTMESRSGYVSVSMAMGGVSLIITTVLIVLELLHGRL